MPPMASTPDAAVILAAGKGTRMRSATAKVLHPLCGRPLAFYPVRRALDAGSRRVVVVVGHQGEAVRAPSRPPSPGRPCASSPSPTSGAPATRCAAPSPRWAGPSGCASSTATCPCSPGPPSSAWCAPGPRRRWRCSPPSRRPHGPRAHRPRRPRAGGADRGAPGLHPAERRLGEINAGIYDVDRKILEAALGNLRADNAQGELYLTDVVAVAVARATVKAVPVANPSEVAGVNDRVELARAATLMRRRINEALMVGGVASRIRRTPTSTRAWRLAGTRSSAPAATSWARPGWAGALPSCPGRMWRTGSSATGAGSGPSPGRGPGRSSRARCTWVTSWRPRRPAWAGAPRPATSPTSATPRWRRDQRRRRDHHLQLRRRRQAPDHPRRRVLHRLEHRPGGAHHRRRRGLRGRRVHPDQGRPRRGPGGGPGAPEEPRGLGGAPGAQEAPGQEAEIGPAPWGPCPVARRRSRPALGCAGEPGVEV